MSTRRRNKSNKVPNVKLRPADAEAVAASRARMAQSAISTAWALDSDGEELEGESASLDPCPRPFKGIIVCATGLVDKASLFKKAVEIGAKPLSDLTDKVTHLVAEEYGSAKYKCAVERKIPIMKPSWIEECWQTWRQGDDIDVEASIAAHRLPIFAGVTVCVSGLDDVARRAQINRDVARYGGAYAKALERPVRVTHLLCTGLAETDKMRYAAKFNRAGEARIRLVWDRWFADCVEFGGRFDEDEYDVSRPCPPPRVKAPAPLPPSPSAPLSSTCEEPSSALALALADDDELVRVRRVPAETLQVWESVLRPRGFVLAGGRLARSPTKSQSQPRTPCPGPLPRPARAQTLQNLPRPRGSALAGLSRAGSFAPSARDASTPKAPFARAATRPLDSPSFFGGMRAREEGEGEEAVPATDKDVPPPAPVYNAEAGPSRPRLPAVFSGLKILARGEAQCANVFKAIEGGGGEALRDDDGIAEADFVVIRLNESAIFQAERDPALRAKYRTECWLERCVFSSTLIPADAHPSFSPLPCAAVGGGVVLSLSGLEPGELCWTRRLARALGLTVAPNFSRRTHFLLCPAGAGTKFEKAREWGVPVVGVAWLAELTRTGEMPSEGHFLIGPGGVPLPAPEPHPELQSVQEEEPESLLACGPEPESSPDLRLQYPSKGKGKQLALEGSQLGISDITNGIQPRAASRELGHRRSLSRATFPAEDDDNAQHGHDEWSFGAPGALLSSAPRADPLPEPSTPPPASSQVAPTDGGRGSSPASEGEFEEQRALQESLANLLVLGKRAPSSEDSPEAARPGKRTRQLTKAKTTALAPDLVHRSPPSFATYEGTSASLSGKHVIDQPERYAHVMHEDPGQRREQAKLLGLLGKAVPGVPPAGRAGARPRPVKKGARRPGF